MACQSEKCHHRVCYIDAPSEQQIREEVLDRLEDQAKSYQMLVSKPKDYDICSNYEGGTYDAKRYMCIKFCEWIAELRKQGEP